MSFRITILFIATFISMVSLGLVASAQQDPTPDKSHPAQPVNPADTSPALATNGPTTMETNANVAPGSGTSVPGSTKPCCDATVTPSTADNKGDPTISPTGASRVAPVSSKPGKQ